MRNGRDDALHHLEVKGEIIRMYTSPKIIASLDAKIVLSTALGHDWQNGSNCYVG